MAEPTSTWSASYPLMNFPMFDIRLQIGELETQYTGMVEEMRLGRSEEMETPYTEMADEMAGEMRLVSFEKVAELETRYTDLSDCLGEMGRVPELKFDYVNDCILTWFEETAWEMAEELTDAIINNPPEVYF